MSEESLYMAAVVGWCRVPVVMPASDSEQDPLGGLKVESGDTTRTR